FELYSPFNYTTSGNPIRYAPIGETFIHFPYRLPEYDWRQSPAVITEAYMMKLFPDVTDGRYARWFDSPMDQNSSTFQMKKFAGNTIIDSSDPFNIRNPESSYLLMRYSDIILLRAEALAELERVSEAADALNEVRKLRLLTEWPGATGDTQTDIKKDIFWERAKELIGEGTHYFDLVRTKRVLNREFTDNPLTPDKFNRGAWTWPINPDALANNQRMVLNTYWIGTGF
ncbi:MAG: RagB/SusD family nutrient uptake outer membrane protein, partial [Pedobacter sp.]